MNKDDVETSKQDQGNTEVSSSEAVVSWRRTEEELPGKNVLVLAYDSKYRMTVVASRNSPYWREGNITYWQPLPEPPC